MDIEELDLRESVPQGHYQRETFFHPVENEYGCPQCYSEQTAPIKHFDKSEHKLWTPLELLDDRNCDRFGVSMVIGALMESKQVFGFDTYQFVYGSSFSSFLTRKHPIEVLAYAGPECGNVSLFLAIKNTIKE